MRVSGYLLTTFFACAALSSAYYQAASDQSTPQSQTQTNSAPAPVAAPATPAPAPSPNNSFTASSVRFWGIDVNASADGYYSFDDNHPASGLNELYNFDDHTNQADLNLAKLTLSRDPAPVGFRVDVGFGRAMELMHSSIPDPSAFRFIEQAYVSVKPKGWKGFEADFGDFVTSAGAEVIESKDNWNYSRSLLFALAIPYYHFGVRTSMPVGSSLNVGLQIVNGWNEIIDDHGNNMQTVGLTGAITRKKFTWSNNYYVGPQYTAVTRGNRNLYDTTLLLTPNDKFNAYINFDYGQQHAVLSGLNHWEGVAFAARYQATKRIAFSPRFEYYDDATGFTTGAKQHLHEITVTGEYKMMDGLLARLEFRHDGSNVPFYDRGAQTSVVPSQTTASIGLIAFFPVKH